MFSAIHHVALIVSDYQKAKHFYVDILGFEILRENHRKDSKDIKLDLRLDGCELELFYKPDSPSRPSYPEARGLRHLAFHVACLEDCIQYLSLHNVKTEPIRIYPYTGRRFTFFFDPDLLPLELYE